MQGLRLNAAEKMASSNQDGSWRSLWSWFGRYCAQCVSIEIESKNSHETTAERRKYDTENDRRIQEWILDSSTCYGHASELSSQSEDSSQMPNDFSDVLEHSDFQPTALATSHHDMHDNPLLAIEVASAPVSKKDQNRNRWKGRLPAVDPADPHVITKTADATTASHPVLFKIQIKT
jgi:hypothetical protein